MTSAIEDQLIEAWWTSTKINSSQSSSTGKQENADQSNHLCRTLSARELLHSKQRAKNHLKLNKCWIINNFKYRSQLKKSLNMPSKCHSGNIKTQNSPWPEEVWFQIWINALSNSTQESSIFSRKHSSSEALPSSLET